MTIPANKNQSNELRERTMQLYLEGSANYPGLHFRLGCKSSTQLKIRVRDSLSGESFGDNEAKKYRPARLRAGRIATEEELMHLKTELQFVKGLYRSWFGCECECKKHGEDNLSL